MFVNYFCCKLYILVGIIVMTGNFFPWTGSAHVMIITPFPTRLPPQLAAPIANTFLRAWYTPEKKDATR